MKRLATLILELLGGVAAVVALTGILVTLILMRWSVPLDFLAPYIASALSDPQRDVRVTIDHAHVTLRDEGRLAIVAHGVALQVGTGGPQITLPEIVVDLSLRAALRGVIAPTRIVLDNPLLHLARNADGRFDLGFASDTDSTSETSLDRILRDLGGPSDPEAPVGVLTELEVHNARFVFDDQMMGVVWRTHADLTLHRDEHSLRGVIDLNREDGKRAAELHVAFDYVRATARLETQLAFRDLLPATWPAAAQALAPLAAIDLPISGTIRTTLDLSAMEIESAACDLRFGAGKLGPLAMSDVTLAISGGRIAASYDRTNRRVVLEEVALDLGGPRFAASGTIDGVGDGLLAGHWPRVLDTALALDANEIPLAALPHLWPESLSPPARRWVLANVRGGAIERAAAKLDLHVDLDAPETVALRGLSGDFAYRDLVVDYFGKLPPAREVAGTATFDLASLLVVPTNAAVLGLRVSDAKISISRLNDPDSRISIALGLRGPLSDALVVLDSEPLGYVRAMGFAAADITGDVTARLDFAFPTMASLKADQIGVTADATMSGVTIPRAVLGQDVTAGAFRLRLDRDAVEINGTAALAGAPVTLGVRRGLAAKASEPLRATLSTRLDGDARHRLGLDFFPGVVSGPVGITLAYETASSNAAKAQISLDLADSSLVVAPLGWNKPAGVPGAAQFAMTLANGHVVAINGLTFASGGLKARLDAGFLSDGGVRLSRLDLQQLVVGGTDARGTARLRDDGSWQVALSGPTFDATALADQLSHAAADEDVRLPPFDLEVRLDRLVLGPGREAQGVHLHAATDGKHWQNAAADATMAGGASMRLRYGGSAAPPRFDLTSDDFGALLQLIGFQNNIRKGRIQGTGIAIDDGAGRRLKLKVDVTDFRVINAPIIGQVLSLASITGISDLLQGEGLPFSMLTANLVLDDDRIDIDDLRTYGAVVGINASGTIDRQSASLAVTGTLVPAHELNTALRHIPIIGNFLLGGEGRGIFDASFSIAGTLNNPQISVNPLSALAPGILRKLFQPSRAGPTAR